MKCPFCKAEVKKDKYGLLEEKFNPFVSNVYEYHNCLVKKRNKHGYDKRHKGKDYIIYNTDLTFKKFGTLEEAREWIKSHQEVSQ